MYININQIYLDGTRKYFFADSFYLFFFAFSLISNRKDTNEWTFLCIPKKKGFIVLNWIISRHAIAVFIMTLIFNKLKIKKFWENSKDIQRPANINNRVLATSWMDENVVYFFYIPDIVLPQGRVKRTCCFHG